MDVPQRLGLYEVLDKVGEGGMGCVFRARDRRNGEQVAIKLLRHQWQSQPERRFRFLREAQIAQRVRHPNVVRVLDYGEVHLRGADRTLYIAMELVLGRDLYHRLSFETLDQREMAEIGRQLADGLAAAHAQSIVHRDLKPGNVLVSGEGKATIVDFGLAKVEDEDEGERSSGLVPTPGATDPVTTQVGDVVGTPAYAAPEQLRGERATARSDLYSLGALLYQMVTGRLPYRGNTHREVLEAMQKGDPEPLTAYAPGVAKPLHDIVWRLLALEPSARFASAEDVADALTSVLEAEHDALDQPLEADASLAAAVTLTRGSRNPGGWLRWLVGRGRGTGPSS